MAGLRFGHLYEDKIALVSRAGHPMLGRSAAEALARSPLILPPQDALIRRAVGEYLLAHNLSFLKPAFETAALPVGRGILSESDALWFISRGVVADELDRGELVQWATGAEFLTGAVGLTWRQAGKNEPMLELQAGLAHDVAALWRRCRRALLRVGSAAAMPRPRLLARSFATSGSNPPRLTLGASGRMGYPCDWTNRAAPPTGVDQRAHPVRMSFRLRSPGNGGMGRSAASMGFRDE